MKEIPGGKGGKLVLSEKGDPSPNKGRRFVSESALLANWRMEKRPKMSLKHYREALLMLFEMPETEWERLLAAGLLTGALAVEVRSWMDKYRGPENLRRSQERVFGREAARIDVTTDGQPVNKTTMEYLLRPLTIEQIEALREYTERRAKKE